MSTETTLIIINSIASLLEAIAVAITLFFVVKQTKSAQQSISEIVRDRKLTTLANMRIQTTGINQLLLEHKDLSDLFGYNRSDILAFMILHDLELQYLLHADGFIDEKRWESDRVVIQDVVNKDFIKSVWKKYKNEYHPDFIKVVDRMVLDD